MTESDGGSERGIVFSKFSRIHRVHCTTMQLLKCLYDILNELIFHVIHVLTFGLLLIGYPFLG
jgi:hypothetical protein